MNCSEASETIDAIATPEQGFELYRDRLYRVDQAYRHVVAAWRQTEYDVPRLRMIWNVPTRCSSGLWVRHGRNSLTPWNPGRFPDVPAQTEFLPSPGRTTYCEREENLPLSFPTHCATKWPRNSPEQWLRRIDTAPNWRHGAACCRHTRSSAWPLCCRTAHCRSTRRTTTASWLTVAVHRVPITVTPYCPSMTVERSCTGFHGA